MKCYWFLFIASDFMLKSLLRPGRAGLDWGWLKLVSFVCTGLDIFVPVCFVYAFFVLECIWCTSKIFVSLSQHWSGDMSHMMIPQRMSQSCLLNIHPVYEGFLECISGRSLTVASAGSSRWVFNTTCTLVRLRSDQDVSMTTMLQINFSLFMSNLDESYSHSSSSLFFIDWRQTLYAANGMNFPLRVTAYLHYHLKLSQQPQCFPSVSIGEVIRWST